VVVGGGSAGLSAAAALELAGFDPLVLDRDERLAGTWARRYERLHLHTIRRFSGLAHHAIPRDYPRYVPKDLFARYLQEYAGRFALRVRLNEPVRRVGRTNGADPLWKLECAGRTWTCLPQVLTRNVQRLNITNAGGVIRSSEIASAIRESSPVPSTRAARMPTLRPAITAPTIM
jgi:cation diffusion facilitator CzcD-associated flavoprotein CzcO